MSNRYLVQSDNAVGQAEVLAQEIAARLNRSVAARGRASIAFSGGSTPVAMLDQLSRQPVDWARVDVTLVDERCVPEGDERSNAGMLRAAFLDKLDVAVDFVPLFVPGETDAIRRARLSDYRLPFDVVHLGMGGDAHTASFFPDASNIGEMIDLEQPQLVMTTQSENSREERVTWSLSALLQTRFFVLQLVGAAKRAVLDQVYTALAGKTITEQQRRELPVLAFLAETRLRNPDGIPGYVYYAGE